MRAALFLTEQCNLDCGYCYINKSARAMDPGLACRAADFIDAHRCGPTGITFFGGEPLLRPDLMRAVADHVRARGYQMGLHAVTNAMLIDEPALDFLAANRISIDIGWHREQWQGGQPARWFPAIQARLPRTIVTRVVARNNFRETIPVLREIIDYGFKYICLGFDFTVDWPEAELDEMAGIYAEVAEIYRQRFLARDPVYINVIDDCLLRGIAQVPGPKSQCDLGRTRLAIDVAGNVYPCVQFITNAAPDSEYCIGHVDRGFNSGRQACIAQNRQTRPECAGCAFDGRCGNWCGCANWVATGRIDRASHRVCAHDKRLIPVVDRMANRLYKEEKALFMYYFYTDAHPAARKKDDTHE